MRKYVCGMMQTRGGEGIFTVAIEGMTEDGDEGESKTLTL